MVSSSEKQTRTVHEDSPLMSQYLADYKGIVDVLSIESRVSAGAVEGESD